jgi:extracellular factor (EF) 3-hydroxypalmitic acid methyl ester biosynthesis protein
MNPEAGKRTPRLRARRITIDRDKLGTVHASMKHAELGTISGEVQDLSLNGIGVILPARNGLSGLLLNGDRVESLEVVAGDTVLYRGAGTVRRISDEAERQVLGLEVDGDGLDLPELHRRGARLSFAQRWEQQELGWRYERIPPEFKAFVADLRSKLEATREFLSREESALTHADQLTREETLQQYLAELKPRMLDEMDGARDYLAQLVGHLDEEEHALHRAYLRRHLGPLLAESPFMRRSFEKPLGYAGDYEMMNMLYRDHAEGQSLFGKALNLYATNEAAARANINRIDYLGEKITRHLDACPKGQRLRLASIGCGPSHEIRSLLMHHPEIGPRLDVALIDQEERSIAYCERTLSPLVRQTGARIQFIRESVRKLLTTKQLAEALGERDFIYSAGLFDYLSDRAFGALLSTLYSAIRPGGTLAVGNVAMHNPSRWPMEYFLDWFLIHRTPEDLLKNGQSLQPTATSIEVESEPTGVNLFLIVQR